MIILIIWNIIITITVIVIITELYWMATKIEYFYFEFKKDGIWFYRKDVMGNYSSGDLIIKFPWIKDK